jgi:hypothetical protein
MAVRRPAGPNLRPATVGTPKARQPDRDLTEQGGDLVRAVVLDLAHGGAGPVLRPPGRMVPTLRRNDFLLNSGQTIGACFVNV